MAWDRSGGEHNGRLYLVYTDARGPQNGLGFFTDTQLLLRYSEDNGLNWTKPIDVTDFDSTNAFFPAVAVDQSSGNLAVSWYTALGDEQQHTRYTATISDDGGVTWNRSAVLVAPGLSDASASTLDPSGFANQYGDYTGLSFVGGIVQPIWTDNSLELEGNPDLRRFEAANARIGVATVFGRPLVVQGVDIKGVAGAPVNAVLARFTDPEAPRAATNYKATIDWGDGTLLNPSAESGAVSKNEDGSFSVRGEHEYKTAGSYSVKVVVNAPHSRGETSLKAEIAKAQKSLVFAEDGKLRVVREVAFTKVLAVLNDANHNSKAADFDVTIAWGDGRFTDGVVALTTGGAAGASNVFSITGTHNYISEQTYAVQVSVRVKADGAKLTTSGAIVNGDPPMTLDITNDIFDALAGITVGDRILAVFTVDGDIQTDVGEYIATINWGDGTVDANVHPFVNRTDGVTVVGRHTYAVAGQYYASITVRDDSGNVATAPLVNTVEPGVTGQINAVGSGLVYDPARDLFVGELTLTNTSGSDIEGPLSVVLLGLPAGVTLESTDASSGAGDPLFKIDRSRLAAGASLEPIALEFSNPGRVPISYTVQVFEGGRARMPDGAALVFEPNRGQANAAASFIARGQGYAIGLSPAGASLLLGKFVEFGGAAASLLLVGANEAAQGQALEPQSGVSNYLQSGQAITGVPHFARVRYASVYTGIDIEYYGQDGVLEYDWVVHAGANADAIGFRFANVDSVRADNAGNLHLNLNVLRTGADLVLRAPLAYQLIGGVRSDVSAAFKLRADGSFGLTLGAYDASVVLVIDPVLVYSTYFGGSGIDPPAAVAVDAEGNTYLTGTTYSSDFFVVHPFDPELNDPGTPPFYFRPDAFITKLDPNGVPVYSSYLGGAANRSIFGYGSSGFAIAVDTSGRVWTTGLTDAETFPQTAAEPTGGLPHVPPDPQGIAQIRPFLTELAADGSALLYSTLFSAGSAIRDLALDGRGGLYATGESRNRVFVLKLDTTSHAVDYLTYLGGGFSFGIAADASGQAYLTGSTEDPNFPAVNALFPALVVPLASDSRDQLRNGFLSKLGSDGQVLFSTYYGGSGGETAYDIAVDPAGTITVGGQTFSKDLPVPGALQAVSGGRGDGFLLKFANDGSQLLYGTYIGGSERDDIRGVAVDGAGRVYFGGSTQSGDFPAMVRAFQPTYLGGAATGQYDFQEGFAGALEANGSALRYLTYIGGSRYDAVLAVAADAAGNASYVGVTTSPDLVTRQAAQTRLLGADTFIERILAQDDGAIALRNVPVRALVGTEFTGVVAAFTSNGTDTANQFSATIDWGDGASSAGSIDGDFHDGFRVLGTHLYATPGTRDLQVTLLDSQGRLVRSTGTTAGPAAADGVVHYRVSVDTTSLRGSSGLIGLEFNPGALPGSPDAQAVVRNLRITGGTLAALSLEGGASGDAAGEAVLRPVTVLNRLLNAVVFGSRIDFDLEISGSALSRPGGGNFADVFALQLLGADGRTPLLTADATASLLRIDVLPNGTTRSRSAGAEASVAALGQANVSRPSTQLNLTVLPFATQEGQAYAGAVGSFTSSDRLQTAAQFSAIVDWGDGTTPTPGTVSGAAGRFALAGNHTYANPGTYRLAITLVDTDGSAVFQRSPLAGAGFLEASPAPLATGNQFQPPLIADLNGDGLLDVVAADWLTGRKMVVRLGLGDFRFGDPIDLPTATSFSLLFAAGDFNGDGRIDLVAANQDPSGARSVSVLLGDGSGHFSAGPAATVIAPSAVSIATADLDEDGRLDVIIGSGFSNGANLPGRLLVLRGRGDGSFQDPVTYSVGSGNISAAVADVNRDGHVDLVVGGTFGSSLRVLLGDGTGALTPLAGLPVSALGFFTVMDVNADSVPDIVAADGDLAVFIGQGDGTFRAERQSLAQPPGSIGVAADLDGDGRAELVYVEAASGALNVLRAGADGRFAIVDTLAIALGVTSLGATDWNGDGKLDVTIAVGTEVRVVIGRGDGTLIAPDTLLAPQLARAVIAVDTNGDGRLDLVSGGSGGVSVQLNQGGSFDDPARILTGGTASTAVMLGDINGDGREDIVTGSATGISVLLRRADGSYAPPVSYAIGQVTELALGDINGDGALDIAASVPANGLARGVSGAAILLNDGRGGLVYSETVGARTGLGTGSGPGSVLLRDLNGDGKADLVVRVQGDFNGSTFVGGGLAIALSGGNRFGAVSVVPAGIDDARARSGIAAGDLNGDGHIDLVTIASGFRLPFPFGTPLNQNGLFVLLGNGDGSFRAGASYLTDGLPNSTRLSSVALADLNGDGRLDIAAARNFNFTGDRVDDTVVLLGAGDGSFGPAATYDGAAEARQLGVADLNGDGVPDLVINEATVDPDKAGVNVLLGVGDGSFGRKSTYYAGDTRAFAVGDLDGDGKSDVLASVDLLVNGTKRGELAALGGRGDGTLKAPLFSLVGRTFPVSLTPVDFNGDAYPDLAVAWSSTNEVGLLIGRGDGSFELRRPVLIPDLGGFPSGSGPKEVTLADIDGDGRAEFVVALSTSGAIVSVPLDNTGNAGTPVYRNAGLGFNDLSAFGDFNSDGVVDVVNVHRVFGTDQGLAVVLRGRGNGSFAASAAVAVGAETQAVVAGDLNNDGHLDLVFSNAGVRDSSLNYNGSLTVMLGNGDGTFKTPVAVAQSQPFGALALVDLNGDGFLDIAAVQGGSSRSEQRGIAVLLNRKDGRFAAPTLYDANVTSNITLNVLLGADLARDGAPELVFAEGSRDGLLRIVQNRAAQAGVVVRNAPLAVTGATINPVAGVAFSALIGTLRDDNPLAPAARHSASIDWGDGVTSAAMITADGQGGFSLTGSHLYATAGVRTIVIAAADSEGGNASGSGRAIVAATDLPLTAEGRAVEAMAGIPFDGVVTRFSDADPNGSASDFHARINWGDGTDTAGQVVAAAGGGFVVRGLHVYDAVGAYSVSVRITDLGGSTAATTSQATVGRLPNRAPIALDDRIVTPEDTPVAFDVRRNDSDPDRELLQVEVVEGPSHGSLEQLADGSFIYRPALNQVQSDSFRYRVRDAAGASAQARVDIELTPLNDAPTLAPIDDQRLAVGQTLSLQVQASDPDAGDSLRFTLDQAPAGATIDSSGRIRWVADGSAGTASFIVRVTDTAGAAATRAFEAVTGAPPPPSTPVASDDVAATAEDAPVTINVLANDSAAEGQVLSVAIVTGPAHGTALLNPEGTITYTPAANYFGSDSFTYRVSDGQAQSNEARVDITIGARNDAPTLAAITDATVMEGQSLSFQVVAFDVEGDALSYAVTGAGAVIDPTGRFSFAALDGDSSHPFTVRVSDGQSFAERSFTVTVANVAPTLGVTGAANVLGGTPYTLNLAATDPGVDTINAWLVNWGDGVSDALSGTATQASHLYSRAGGAFTIHASATDEDGSTNAAPLDVTVTPDLLDVQSFTATATGFKVRFDHAFDASTINLYDPAGGPADVALKGDLTGTVTGSLLFHADRQGISFIRSGGILQFDSYNVRLASGPAGFHDAISALDGNQDGTPGDDYLMRFDFRSTGAGVLSLPDFMRGPGQPVDVPAVGKLLPVTFTSAGGMRNMVFTVDYDPRLLNITGANAAANLPPDTEVRFDTQLLGTGSQRARITVILPGQTTLAAGATRLIDLVANVPASARYGAKQVLDIAVQSINGSAALPGSVADDDALHVVGYFGDTSGNAAYSTLDGQMVQRVMVKLDPGFAAWANVDPLLVADITGDGKLNSLDATRLLQEVSYLTGASTVDRLEIPPIPPGIGPISFSGPDPVVDIPRDLVGAPGDVVTLPVRLDTAAGLESVQLRMGYDASQFELVQVRRGTLTEDFGWFVVGNTPGQINVDMTRLTALQGGSGTLLNVDLRILPGATAGAAGIDLQYARLNDGHLTLNTEPQVGGDASDGRINIRANTPVAAQTTLAMSEVELPPTETPASEALLPDLAAFQTPPSVHLTAAVPVIDFGAAPAATAALPGLALATTSKPWLKDYLNNAGQATKVSPNLGLRVTIPMAASASFMASSRG